MAGADGQIYSSEDYGETWVNEGEDLGVSSDIYAVNQTSTALMVGGTDGCLMRKPVAETKNGAISSLYDMETQEWTQLKSTGYMSDISFGSPYDISGDGKYVVGLAPWKESDGNSVVMLRYGVQKQVCLLTLEHVLKAEQPALMVQVMTEVSL